MPRVTHSYNAAMRNWHVPARAGGALAATGLLGGCTGDTGPWLFGSVALVVSALTAGAAGWLIGRRRDRRALHAARQENRLLLALAGGDGWRTTVAGDRIARLADGRRLSDLYDLGPQAATMEATLTRPDPFGPCEWSRRDGGGAHTVGGVPWFHGDGRFGGHVVLARPGDGGGQAAMGLKALAETWPDVLAVLVRQGDDAPWRLLQASAAARAVLGRTDRFDGAALQALLPPALGAALGTPGDAQAEGWQLHHVAADGAAVLLLVRAGSSGFDDTATMSYTVSHDLRAPIRVVEGFTRIVKEDYGNVLDRVANDHLDRVLGATARMNQMIDAMLTLARLSTQPLARQPVNLSQLATFVIDDLRRAAPDREAVIQVEPDLQATGDPTLLRLVLENLLGNAWKYTAKRAQAHIVFGRETTDGQTAFVVRDNGAGFDMRSAERLFGLFQRLHSASDFAGTGVGLASVRRIVQRHGGRIWADGEPGRGAAFYFTLRN